MRAPWIGGAIALALLAAGCSSSGSKAAAGGGTTGSSAGTVTITVKSGRLTAPNGKTLYYNTVDTASKISCVGQCASIWPPLTGHAKAGSGIDAGDLSTATRPDGTVEVTYYGHPLYEYSGDTAAGDAKGNGIADGGGRWIAATPQQAAHAPSAPPSTAGGGGYGGY